MKKVFYNLCFLLPGYLCNIHTVSAQDLDLGNIMDSIQISKAVQPNVILILLDDARYDLYSCNGAPSYFQTPSIDRIANEGVNFKSSFVTQSLCAPSRATIATGVYSVKHGVIDNYHQSSLNPDLKVLPEILHDQGYHTALIGKNHEIFTYANGFFDLWIEENYPGDTIVKFNYNGVNKTVSGYHTDVFSDSAVAYISRTSSPYFLWLGYNAPHAPLIPAPQYKDDYAGMPTTLGADTAQYSINYPSFLYNLGATITPKGANSQLTRTYEMIASVNDGVEKILHTLDSLGKLDNTMIIFTSDNGHLRGEHGLNTKRVAYEQSLRVPLFIRYKKWFPSSTIVENQIALNIDIAPTILHAAGITDTFNMDGKSLYELYTGSMKRKKMYYHYWYAPDFANLPPVRAVRDLNYKLITYGCDDETREFFDMVNDPKEMTNLINTSSYASLIQDYQDKLLKLETLFGDTTDELIQDCFLANPEYTKESLANDPPALFVYPNPTDGSFAISGIDNGVVQILNCIGQIIWEGSVKNVSSPFQHHQFPDGFYYLRIHDNTAISVLELVLIN